MSNSLAVFVLDSDVIRRIFPECVSKFAVSWTVDIYFSWITNYCYQ